MEDSWAIFTDDLEEEAPQPRGTFLPSSLRSGWNEEPPMFQSFPNKLNERKLSYNYDLPPQQQPFTHFPVPESAPQLPYQMNFGVPNIPGSTTQIAHNSGPISTQPETIMYATVMFRATRNEIYKFKSSMNLKPGDYVITEADRGIDIGKVTQITARANSREARNARSIARPATDIEIRTIPAKIEKEKRATEICQQKAQELGLDMTITDAEFQFDGKKLTVYFSAKQYIDFRNLVRVLFKIFETRIWMVWFDGTAPVKDVLEQRKPLMNQRETKIKY